MSALEAEVERQLERMRVGCELFEGEADLRRSLARVLQDDRPLRVKLGMDPSAPDLHLGHTITLEKLRVFQELGHTPIFLIGDFTARIGDPTGKKKTRPALDEAQVQQNAETYVAQVSQVLDVEHAEIRYNSEWMDSMGPGDFVHLCSCTTLARMLERDDFERRYKGGEPISIHELLYPLVQAYDSVALEADVEIGGTDQTFNLLMGREIQRSYGQEPQAVITHPLLVGTDGKEKMSKSLGNSIDLAGTPGDTYGRTMSISDSLMVDYLARLSFGRWDDLAPQAQEVREGRGDPLGLKHELARRIVERFHGAAAAEEAAGHFRRVVQAGQLPEKIPEFTLALSEAGLLDVLRKALDVPSNAEGRRLVAQGAVRLEGEVVKDASLHLPPGTHLLRAGKRRYARVTIRGRR